MSDIEATLKKLLTTEDISELRIIQQIKNNESRQAALKNFFIQPARFDIIKEYIDPVWLAYEIFINKAPRRYEF